MTRAGLQLLCSVHVRPADACLSGHFGPDLSPESEYKPRRAICSAGRSVAFCTLALTAPALALGAVVPGAGALAPAAPATSVVSEDAAGMVVPLANETRYGIAVGVGETDNVKLTSTDRQWQTLAVGNVDFTLARSGSRLAASALGNFSYLYYPQHAYGSHLLGRFDGLAILKLWPHHLDWIVRDDYGESQLDLFGAVTPVNLQRVNVLTTGPDLTLRPTDASFVELEALYQRITYQTSPFDAKYLTGSVAVGRQFSPLSRISLVAKAQELRFDNGVVNTNFDRRELYGDYSIVGARTAIEVQLGATQANDTGSWKTSPLGRLSLSRKMSPFSTVMLSGGREYNDVAGAFSELTAGAAGGIAIGSVAQTSANYVRDYARAGWVFSRLRTTLAFTGTWERDTYDQRSVLLYNATSADAQLSLGRRLTRGLRAYMTGSWTRTQYENQGFTDRYGTVGAGLTWRPGRWLEVYARYDHSLRRPKGAQALASGYDENRVFVMVGYRPHTAADGAAPQAGSPFPGGE